MAEHDSTERMRRDYDAYAPRYDADTSYYERLMLGDGRSWACSQARGRVLEVAVGTGRNLRFYPPGVQLTGVDLSRGMLALARARADALGMPVDLVEGDAQALPFDDATFDTVICTLGLSSVPDHRCALREMHRVLRPGGHLVTLGHVAGSNRPIRAFQHLLERLSARRGVRDTQSRRIVPAVVDAGFTLVDRRYSRFGAIERLTATKLASTG